MAVAVTFNWVGGLTFFRDRTWLPGVTRGLRIQTLKGVSRSFYLTLQLLPQSMRGAASLGYLLARTSDTLADTAVAPLHIRLQCMEQFRTAVAGESEIPRWPVSMCNAISDPRERHLLECSAEILLGLRGLPDPQATLVREVVAIIITGQTMDLQRFAAATDEHPVALHDDAELEDYAWRVAGCVGAFWTKLGFLTQGDRFSNSGRSQLLDQGIAYGKGLQIVNILRDVAEDLRAGRCYLPVADPMDSVQLHECHTRWLAKAEEWISQGEIYARTLNSRRMRAATVLPAMLARKTLASLHETTWEALQTRTKIPRSAVYCSVIHACCISAGRR
jgi:farnesyl-diphosphate farnesyltransferase